MIEIQGKNTTVAPQCRPDGALKRAILAAAVVFWTHVGCADVVPWIYDADVAVASQSDAERRRGAGAVLLELLTRLTGMREIPFGTEVDRAVAEPERYYVRYGFSTRNVPDIVEGGIVTETRLQIRFDQAALLAMLARAGLPVWSADRPRVLAWIVVQDDTGRRFVSATSTTGEAASAAVAARRRALDVAFPLMDLEDRGLRDTDAWGGFWTAVAIASRRYAPDLVLLGRVAETHRGNYRSDWELKFLNAEGAGFAARFDHSGSSSASTVGEAVHRVADVLAQRFAVRGGDLGAVAVTVRGAQTVRGYAALMAHLSSREYITRVVVEAVERGALHLRLHSRSPRDQLVELLLMGGYLSASQSDADSQPLAVAGLDLTWEGVR